MFYVHEVRNLLRLAIFERQRGQLGSKISSYGQLAEVAVYFVMCPLGEQIGSQTPSIPSLLFPQHQTFQIHHYATGRFAPILLKKSKIYRSKKLPPEFASASPFAARCYSRTVAPRHQFCGMRCGPSRHYDVGLTREARKIRPGAENDFFNSIRQQRSFPLRSSFDSECRISKAG
jgi:hypothetical protein